jgi:hypothetical protein
LSQIAAFLLSVVRQAGLDGAAAEIFVSKDQSRIGSVCREISALMV